MGTEACSRGRRLGRGGGQPLPLLPLASRCLVLCLPVFSSSLRVHICPRPLCTSGQGQGVADWGARRPPGTRGTEGGSVQSVYSKRCATLHSSLLLKCLQGAFSCFPEAQASGETQHSSGPSARSRAHWGRGPPLGCQPLALPAQGRWVLGGQAQGPRSKVQGRDTGTIFQEGTLSPSPWRTGATATFSQIRPRPNLGEASRGRARGAPCAPKHQPGPGSWQVLSKGMWVGLGLKGVASCHLGQLARRPSAFVPQTVLPKDTGPQVP